MVYDVPDEHHIIVAISADAEATNKPASAPLVAVAVSTPATVTKGQKFSVSNVIADKETYDYAVDSGHRDAELVRTLKVYSEAQGITFKEFMTLRQNGFKFPEDRE